MRMQEPEQGQPFGREWLSSQEHNEYRADYTGRYEPEQQQGYIEAVAGENYQQQKIYPQDKRSSRGKALGIFAIVFASLGFFIAVAGIVVSAIVLKYANGQEERLTEGVIGLVASIVGLLVCVAIFVIAVIALAIRARRVRWRTGTRI